MKYQSSSTHCSKVITKVKNFKKWVILQGQGHRVINNGTHGKVLSQGRKALYLNKLESSSPNKAQSCELLQSLKSSTFPFMRSYTVRSPSVHRALIVRSSFTVLRSAFTVRSRSPFTKLSAFAHRSFTYRSQSVHRSFSVQSSLSFGTLKLKDQYHDLGTKG